MIIDWKNVEYKERSGCQVLTPCQVMTNKYAYMAVCSQAVSGMACFLMLKARERKTAVTNN